MVNRVNIIILMILFLLLVGREYMRANTLMIVNNSVNNSMIEPDKWEEVYQWVTADKNVPDREEVLMLIQYHYGSFDRLTELLCYLNGGRAYRYLSQVIFPRIGRCMIKSEELPIADIRMSEKMLPMIYISAERIVPSAVLMAEEKKADTSRKVIVALKNNILYDLVLAPNVEVELSIGRKWSLNTEYKCPWWLNSRHSFAISFSREVWKFVIGWATEICVTS